VTATSVLREVERLGIALSARGTRLHVEAIPGRITTALREGLREHKHEILAMLAAPHSIELASLRGGLVVPSPALRLALDLEARGFALRLDPELAVVIEPVEDLSPEDLVGIQRWRHHLGAIVQYQPPELS
jgi:hypothetical protein